MGVVHSSKGFLNPASEQLISEPAIVAGLGKALCHQLAQAGYCVAGLARGIQAGRELRVIVGSDQVLDKESETLSYEIAKKIQDEMTYPGQVKITVIRETRAINYAK